MGNGALAVDGIAQAVQDAAQKLGTDVHVELASGSDHGAARLDPFHGAQGHQEQAIFAETHHLGGHDPAVAAVDMRELSHAGRRPEGLDHQADDLSHLAFMAQGTAGARALQRLREV